VKVARANTTREKIVTIDDEALEVITSVHVAFTYPPPPPPPLLSETQEPILNGAGFNVDFPVHVDDESYLISDAEDPVQILL
jgi:hypothetical protein